MEACATTTNLFGRKIHTCPDELAILTKARLIKASKIDVIHVWGYCKPICFTNDTECSRTTATRAPLHFRHASVVDKHKFCVYLSEENLEAFFFFCDYFRECCIFHELPRFDGWRTISK